MTPDEKVLDDITTLGWHVIKVAGDDRGPAFAYTIGLMKRFGHPELIVFGLSVEIMHAILNSAGESIKGGTRYSAGSDTDDLLEGYSCKLVAFPRNAYKDHLGYALWFYEGQTFDAVQCVWPDRAGRYPWDREASAEFKALQPMFAN